MKTAIVILNYKTYQMTLALIDQLYARLNMDKYQILVVDNASPNESAAILAEHSQGETPYIFLSNKENAGYAAGNNIGIRYAQEHHFPYVLIANNDIEIPSEEVLDQMQTLIESAPKIAAVSPRIIGGDRHRDPPIYFKCPSFWDMTFGIRRHQRARFLFDETKNVRIYAPRGSFMLLRCQTLQEVGNLDEATFLYYEEPILAERLRAVGAEVWHCGSAQVIHNHAVTITSTLKKKTIAKNVCNSYRYYLKHYRNMGVVRRLLCLFVRYLAILTRR